jgi:DNA-binding HxlR family transcriptional regulator
MCTLVFVSRRSYGQYCGLAAALDVVGQRWALLIVRDLAPGPRRFTDLFDGLPGISTDMLAERLRSLEEAGAVQRRAIRSPAPANLYELTDRGRELARLVGEMAHWGMGLLPPADEAPDLVPNVRWSLQLRATRYRGGLPDGDVHITLDDREELTLSIAGDRARLVYGHTDAAPLLTIEASTPGMFELLRTAPANTASDLPPHVAVDGPADVLATLVGSLAD